MAVATGVKRHRLRKPKPAKKRVLTALVAADTMLLVKSTKGPTKGQPASALAAIGARVKYLRELRRMGINELNRKATMPDGKPLSGGYISKLEAGKRKDVEAVHIGAIAVALDGSADWLISGRGPMELLGAELTHVVGSIRADKANLEGVLRSKNIRGRWGEPAINAARAQVGDVSSDEWERTLDALHSALKVLDK